MIVENVTIECNKIVVSYSGDDLSLITPEMRVFLMAFWKDRIEKITAEVLGCPGFKTFSGNAPEREHVPLKEPVYGCVIPDGST